MHLCLDKLGGEALEMYSPGFPSADTFTLRLNLSMLPFRMLSDILSTRSDGSFTSTSEIVSLMFFPDNVIISTGGIVPMMLFLTSLSFLGTGDWGLSG